MKQFRPQLLTLLFLFLVGCSWLTTHGRAYNRAEKAANRGDYYLASLECVKAIKAKRSFQDPYKLMDDVFPKAIKSHHTKLDRLKRAEQKNWDLVIKSYRELVYLISEIEKLDVIQQEVWFMDAEIRDYGFELEESFTSAAEYYYSRGTQLMEKNKKESYKKAAKTFKKAMTYVDGYRDAEDMYQLCRQKALKRIAVLSFENNSGTSSFGAIGDEVSDAVISRMLKDNKLMEFIEIVSRDQVDMIIEEQKLSQSGLVDFTQSVEIGKILGIEELITGKVSRIQVSEPQNASTRTTQKKDVVTGEEVYTDDEGIEKKRLIIETVNARVSFYELTVDASMTVSCSRVEVETAKILSSNSYSENYKFNHKWATYTGDKRALTKEARSLTRKKAATAPSAGEMISELSSKISGKIKKDLKNALD